VRLRRVGRASLPLVVLVVLLLLLRSQPVLLRALLDVLPYLLKVCLAISCSNAGADLGSDASPPAFARFTSNLRIPFQRCLELCVFCLRPQVCHIGRVFDQ
jgi:hypothetical protein